MGRNKKNCTVSVHTKNLIHEFYHMNKIKCALVQVSLAASAIAGALCASTNAYALSIDYRHEYVDVSKSHKDRFMLSDTFANGFGYSVETKAKSGGNSQDEAYSDMESNGAEFSVSYKYKLNSNIFVQPAMNIEFGDHKAIYKPSFKVQYTFDNGIYVAARYRFEYTRENQENKIDENCHRYEGWLGYKTGPWAFEGNYIWRDSDKIRFDNKETDYEYDFKVAYQIDNHWAPFAQIGNVKVDSTSDARQTRFRVGIKYNY